jgi:hypothetical protein
MALPGKLWFKIHYHVNTMLPSEPHPLYIYAYAYVKEINTSS